VVIEDKAHKNKGLMIVNFRGYGQYILGLMELGFIGIKGKVLWL
jgi:hypothetical protein